MDAVEIWHHYSGASLTLEIAEDGKEPDSFVLGVDLSAGERPVGVVPADAWQSARSNGDWTLVGCTVAPAFEFAGFEIVDSTNLGGTVTHTEDMLQYEYARAALKSGLVLEQQLGSNPFKFGMVGSTDAHTGFASTVEDNWWGKAPFLEPSPKRWEDVLIRSSRDPKYDLTAFQLAAAGLAGVWAHENTREAIWDAFARREVFGTSGTRLQGRVFGGFDFALGAALSETAGD